MAEKQRRRRNPIEDMQNVRPLDESRRSGDALQGDQLRQARERMAPAAIDVRELEARLRSSRPAGRPTMQQISSENSLIGEQIINTWLTDGFFAGTTHRSPGPTTRENFIDGNPRVVTKPSNWFWQFEEDSGFAPLGVSPYGGSRIADWLSGRDWGKLDVFVSSSVLPVPDRYLLITHELLHSAAEANGGLEMHYIGEGGRRVSLGNVRWFHEGTTELFAQELVRGHGMEPGYVAYPYETLTCFLIQGVLIESFGEEEGRRMMRDAYINGDLSSIRNTIDSKLGRGTFDRMVGMERGIESADEIYSYIRGRSGASLLGWSGGTRVTWDWENDPMIRHIFRELEDPNATILRLAARLGSMGASRRRD